jgi:hypothetical protein
MASSKKRPGCPGLLRYYCIYTVDRNTQPFLCPASRDQVSTTVSGFSEIEEMP